MSSAIPQLLGQLRNKVAGACKAGVQTVGLRENQLFPRFANDKNLESALKMAVANYDSLKPKYKQMMESHPEDKLISDLQQGYVNFYTRDAINPFIPLASFGPWIISTHGAVIYDTGGYGMLGLGQNPPTVREALSKDYTQANIMTVSFAQEEFTRAIQKEFSDPMPKHVGSPYEKVMCLNSGSEAVGLAIRIADIHSKEMSTPGSKWEDWEPVSITLAKAFHGRTEAPATHSDSSTANYKKHLASWENRKLPIVVKSNDIEDLKRAFAECEAKKQRVQIMTIEPVAGEGNPGIPIDPEFYKTARELTRKHDGILMIDSVQAGLRTKGQLSYMDKGVCATNSECSSKCGPGKCCMAPDLETFAKAIVNGQVSLSVVAVNKSHSDTYKIGLYGNTMTANPRSLAVATAVFDALTPEVRQNIVDQGLKFKAALAALQPEFPDMITHATGTGLLTALHFKEEFPVVGEDGIETRCRKRGLGVIHGGKNALRFTPWFKMSDDEVDLTIEIVREVVSEFRKK